MGTTTTSTTRTPVTCGDRTGPCQTQLRDSQRLFVSPKTHPQRRHSRVDVSNSPTSIRTSSGLLDSLVAELGRRHDIEAPLDFDRHVLVLGDDAGSVRVANLLTMMGFGVTFVGRSSPDIAGLDGRAQYAHSFEEARLERLPTLDYVICLSGAPSLVDDLINVLPDGVPVLASREVLEMGVRWPTRCHVSSS